MIEFASWSGVDEHGDVVHIDSMIIGPEGAPSIVRPEARPPEATCRHGAHRIYWIMSEARWVSGSNDHSRCPEAPHGRHEPA